MPEAGSPVRVARSSPGIVFAKRSIQLMTNRMTDPYLAAYVDDEIYRSIFPQSFRDRNPHIGQDADFFEDFCILPSKELLESRRGDVRVFRSEYRPGYYEIWGLDFSVRVGAVYRYYGTFTSGKVEAQVALLSSYLQEMWGYVEQAGKNDQAQCGGGDRSDLGIQRPVTRPKREAGPNEAGAMAVQAYGQQFQEKLCSYPLVIHVVSNSELLSRDLEVDRQFLLSEEAPQEFAWAICPMGTWISAAEGASVHWDAFRWWNRGSWHGPHEFFLFVQGRLQEVEICEFLAWIGPEWEQRDRSQQEQDQLANHQQMLIDAKKNVTHAKIYLEEHDEKVSDLDGTK
jgi:hypothetical protein